MLLLVFESLGTWELLLVGMVALVVFGPRKIPEIARKAGKMMAEFRKVSSDFRATWEQEASLGEDEKNAFNFAEEPVIEESAIPELEHPSLVDADMGVDSIKDEEAAPDKDKGVSKDSVPEISELTDEKQIEALKKSVQTPESDLNDKENWF